MDAIPTLIALLPGAAFKTVFLKVLEPNRLACVPRPKMLAMLDLALRAQIANPTTPIAVKTTDLGSVRSTDSMASLRRHVWGLIILMGGKLRVSSLGVLSLPSCSSSGRALTPCFH